VVSKKLAINGGEPVRKEKLPRGLDFGREYYDIISNILKSGILSKSEPDSYVVEFEKKFAEYHDVKYAVSTNSGTAALHVALTSVHLNPGDEVIVPSFTFASPALVTLQCTSFPVFSDIDPQTYCIDPKDVEQKITDKTKAIIPVHLFGHPADIISLQKIADRNEIKIIEDACQAHGAKLDGKLIGSFGNLTCYSFNQSKNMTTGEGGMILCDDENLIEELYEISRLGISRKSGLPYDYTRIGFNYIMTEFEAAIGILQLSKLNEFNKKRIEISEYYSERLRETDLKTPESNKNVYHVRHNYPVLLPKDKVDKRDWFIKAARAEGIPLAVNYPSPLYESMRYLNDVKINGEKRDYNNCSCPIAKDVSSRLITLFTDPIIDNQLREDICNAIIKVYDNM